MVTLNDFSSQELERVAELIKEYAVENCVKAAMSGEAMLEANEDMDLMVRVKLVIHNKAEELKKAELIKMN